MKEKIFNISDDKFNGERIDKFLGHTQKNMSRSFVQKLIKEDRIKINGESISKSSRIKTGDKISIKIPEPQETELEPVKMDLDILYEDQNIIVVNKPADIVVHPAPGNRSNTLVNGLLSHTDDLAGINNVKRPGIVHRLDKDTSGVLVVAKNDLSMKSLSQQFKQRKVKKIYHTILKGRLPYKSGKIEAPIGRDPYNRKKMAVRKNNSKKAITFFEIIKKYDKYSYVRVELKTGRTHQIRVHFSYINHPVVGDKKYGNGKDKVKRQLLHAYQLGFFHPEKNEWMEFEAPLPDDFTNFLKKLK